jgi:homoserine O-acetyltransferase
MKWARKVGVLSYIGPELIEHRYGRRCSLNTVGASGTRFEVEGYLEHQAQKFERTFNPWSYWYISRAMDLFDLAAHGGSREAAFKRMRVERALVIGVEEDHLFPIDQQREVARYLRDAGVATEFEDLNSPHGHDAFLVEHAEFGKALRQFLAALESGVTAGPFERARAVG